MDQGKATLLSVGGVLIVLSILLPSLVLGASDSWEDVFGGIVFLIIVVPILFITGIALLIAGATRGRGQQQQQQVVVVSESQAEARGLVRRHCTNCGQAMPPGQKFCNACGHAAGGQHG